MDSSSYHRSYSRVQLGTMTKRNPIDRQARDHVTRDLRSCTTVLSKQATGFLPLNALFALSFDKIINAPLQPDWSRHARHTLAPIGVVFSAPTNRRESPRAYKLAIGFCQRPFPLHTPHLSSFLRAYLASSRRPFHSSALSSIVQTKGKLFYEGRGSRRALRQPPRSDRIFIFAILYSPLCLPT